MALIETYEALAYLGVLNRDIRNFGSSSFFFEIFHFFSTLNFMIVLYRKWCEAQLCLSVKMRCLDRDFNNGVYGNALFGTFYDNPVYFKY